ncbi:hypothetical protein ROZALSC1DRAFT_20182 [Rozella allomycis CSF55]|uniref:Homeobox domain-containing protein n=1 Tax=Rozella allomycis (strain CSF55) TaxID=988480 RepID=A0A4P9YR72_ROZAC|nr:hypothetical protein ROZALSC1DRAFT_20182 [Rozella allomycis CSF55]
MPINTPVISFDTTLTPTRFCQDEDDTDNKDLNLFLLSMDHYMRLLVDYLPTDYMSYLEETREKIREFALQQYIWPSEAIKTDNFEYSNNSIACPPTPSSCPNSPSISSQSSERSNFETIKNKHPVESLIVLENWLKDHRDYPYCTGKEREELAKRANLSIKQVSTWLINARKRRGMQKKSISSKF